MTTNSPSHEPLNRNAIAVDDEAHTELSDQDLASVAGGCALCGDPGHVPGAPRPFRADGS